MKAEGESGSGMSAVPTLGMNGKAAAWRRRSARIVARQALRDDLFFKRFAVRRHAGESLTDTRRSDCLFATPDDDHQPEQVFDRLRWGGQFVFMSPRQWQVAETAQLFHGKGGFVIDQGPGRATRTLCGIPLPVGKPVHYFTARRVDLVPPGEYTDRFTFSVKLAKKSRLADDYIVCKQMPSYGSVVARLRRKFPDASLSNLESRARKLVDRVFPVFLTREAAFLQLLQRDLPPEYRSRFPRLLAVDKKEDGLVRKFYMNWMRMGNARKLTQIQFASQSAELLRVLHDEVGIIHLDLRLDNVVITPEGVGIVDFGSAVRVDEDLSESPMLRSLFDEMMSTSQIQKTLGKMRDSGRLTSTMFINAYQKVDKAVDLFYLALQMNRPHLNPDFVDLIEHDPESDDAKRIRLLTEAVLRPKDPGRPTYISAGDLVRGLRRVEAKQAVEDGR